MCAVANCKCHERNETEVGVHLFHVFLFFFSPLPTLLCVFFFHPLNDLLSELCGALSLCKSQTLNGPVSQAVGQAPLATE